MLVGLTGGIAAGKSTVADVLGEQGAAVLDADLLAREVLEEADVQRRVVEALGGGVLDAAGRIDRQLLGRMVFADAAARRTLEEITHPAIVLAARRRVEDLRGIGHRVVVYEAALLVETGRHREMDILVVVIADDAVRLRRLVERTGLGEEEARRRMDAQLPQREKAALAHYLIDNSGDLEETRRRTLEVWRIIQRRGEEEP